jgi:hypothetical protein
VQFEEFMKKNFDIINEDIYIEIREPVAVSENPSLRDVMVPCYTIVLGYNQIDGKWGLKENKNEFGPKTK